MEAIEFMPGQGSVKFLKHLIAPVTTIGSGLISGFAKEPMNIVAENGDIVFQVGIIYHFIVLSFQQKYFSPNSIPFHFIYILCKNKIPDLILS